MAHERHPIAAADDLAAKFRAVATAERLRDEARAVGIEISADDRIGEADLAKLLNLAPGTLANRRRFGNAPTSYLFPFGRHRITYRIDDVAFWIEKHRDIAA